MIKPESNPRILELAREASRKIKTLTDAHNAQIEGIYIDFRTKANAIQEQVSASEMPTPSADSLPTTKTDDKEITQS